MSKRERARVGEGEKRDEIRGEKANKTGEKNRTPKTQTWFWLTGKVKTRRGNSIGGFVHTEI